MPLMRIAIIGGGPSGMAMATQILKAREAFGMDVDFVVFERRDEVGGIWQYDDEMEPGYLSWETDEGKMVAAGRISNKDAYRRLRYSWKEERPPGPMFEGLRTNIPSDIMAYRDTPFEPSTSLFPSRRVVQQYLEDFATTRNLRPHIRFNTSVTSLKKAHAQWTVKSRRSISTSSSHQEVTESFSHVAVCHGRCNTPGIPNLVGLDTYTGRVMHSAWYRDPSTMQERNVLVVGNASSGMDLCREFAGYVTRTLPSGMTPSEWEERCQKDPFQIYSSWHSMEKVPPMDYNPLDPESPDWSRRITVLDQIEKIEGSKIYFQDGTTLDHIQVIIFATGYLFDNPYIDQTTEPLLSRPFLPPSNHTSKIGFPTSTMFNLDDWLIFHVHDTSIAFLGLPIWVVPFPLAEAQACYIAHFWLQKVAKLPLLDTTISVDDPLRWSSRRAASTEEEEREEERTGGEQGVVHLEPCSHNFGHLSDTAYVDALMAMMKPVYPEAGARPSWEEEYEGDGLGNGTPKGPEDIFAVCQWRIERRTKGKQLRREILGY